MTWLDIINHFYPAPSRTRDILLLHSFQVATLALEIAHRKQLALPTDQIIAAAMLHDLGIIATHAPALNCHGTAHYLLHGDIGADMIRSFAGSEWELYARVAERHTGAGITDEDIALQELPLSSRCHMPETLLEKLICYADKFYSKSGSMERKTPERARLSLIKFGSASAERFDALARLFE